MRVSVSLSCLITALVLALSGIGSQTAAIAQGNITEMCPGVGIQPRPISFEPSGIILTAWDRFDMWVYDIRRNTRYPLPNTAPCGPHCNLTRDAQWVSYHNPEAGSAGRMRLDGTQRRTLVTYASEVEWWSEDRILVWTASQDAYLFSLSTAEIERLPVPGLVNVQPGGYWGTTITLDDDSFVRSLVNINRYLESNGAEERVRLSDDLRYFNASAWSPDGDWLAFVVPGRYERGARFDSAELFAIQPGDETPTQWTDFTGQYGPVRINGLTPGELSWSPDGTKLAFWVIPLDGADPETDGGIARLHVLDVATLHITIYCDYETDVTVPNPPRLIWSPDGTHIALGAYRPLPDSGTLLMALNLATGVYTELSPDVFPATGIPDVVVWGTP